MAKRRKIRILKMRSLLIPMMMALVHDQDQKNPMVKETKSLMKKREIPKRKERK